MTLVNGVIRAVVVGASLLAVQLALVVHQAGAADWVIETVDVYHVGKFNSLAIDSSDRPHISYYDAATGNVKYATKVGTAWVPEVVALAGQANGGSIAVYTSIAVDSAGTPHIVYFDDNTNQLKYAVKSGTSWTIEVVDPGCGPPCALNGFFPSLALDSSGNPHVSYYGNPGGITNGYLKYAHKSGGTWKTEIVDTDGDTGNETSIAVDASGNPHIAYLSGLSHSQQTLKYATKAGGTWKIEVVDASGRATDPSLALDASGDPRISYHEWNLGTLLYAARSGGVWTTEPVDQPANIDVGRYSSLAMDPKTNTPSISYFDISSLDLKYAATNAQKWTTEVVDANGDVGRFSRLAFDSAGGPHISYYDGTAYSLKYASIRERVKPDHRVPISPPEFPYKVTIETRCAESFAGVCLRKEIVRTCVGGNCFDLPRPVPGPVCVRCALGASGGVGALIGLGLGGLGAGLLMRRRRP